VSSPDDAVFASLSRLYEKLERAKAELDQSEITRQLQARDLVHRTDEAREFRLDRDDLESRLDDAVDQLVDAKERVQELESALCVAVSDADTARAAASFQRTRL
jgi:chromosome segregation ATPase